MEYVMSDIHGCYDKFISMLKLINFSEEDTLYILGDIFDRGDKPLQILDYIVSHKNIILLKGNHEQMFEEYFENGDVQLWYWNGGDTTHQELVKRDYLQEESIYRYIRKLPYVKVVDKFILVHADLYLPKGYENLTTDEIIKEQEEEFCLWNRPDYHNLKQLKNYVIIHGHTPVQTITNGINDVKILHKDNHIFIDCGCVFEKANGKLACLCLDTMEEYYV